MAYIKFKLQRITDVEGRTVTANVKRMESDARMDNGRMLDMNQPNLIYHALSFTSSVIKMWLRLDIGVLDRDMLMGAEPLVIDVGILDCDTLK
jgi:hypothetical protein